MLELVEAAGAAQLYNKETWGHPMKLSEDSGQTKGISSSMLLIVKLSALLSQVVVKLLLLPEGRCCELEPSPHPVQCPAGG